MGLFKKKKNRPNNNLLHIEQLYHIWNPNNQLWRLIFRATGNYIMTISTSRNRKQ